MRNCPWCNGEMECGTYYDYLIQREVALLVCKERCQHRRCQLCDVPIHRGGKNDPNYYDNNGNAGCYVQKYYDADNEWEGIVGHQP